jgi:hypothetical protein
LQASGNIRRVPVNGRFDQQRYQYALWRPNPLRGFKLAPEEVQTELARKYFGWFGPASAAEFQRFSGLGVKAAKAALEPLKLEPLEATPSDQLFFLPGDRSKFDAFKPPKEPHYSLLGSIDSMFEHRTLFEDFESHAIVDRGRLVGVWEYDTTTESIAWRPFVKKDKALEQAVTRTEAFVRDQLGDARSFSLDSPKSRAPRIAALRNAAAGA